jgi:hypothetical protein
MLRRMPAGLHPSIPPHHRRSDRHRLAEHHRIPRPDPAGTHDGQRRAPVLPPRHGPAPAGPRPAPRPSAPRPGHLATREHHTQQHWRRTAGQDKKARGTPGGQDWLQQPPVIPGVPSEISHHSPNRPRRVVRLRIRRAPPSLTVTGPRASPRRETHHLTGIGSHPHLRPHPHRHLRKGCRHPRFRGKRRAREARPRRRRLSLRPPGLWRATRPKVTQTCREDY